MPFKLKKIRFKPKKSGLNQKTRFFFLKPGFLPTLIRTRHWRDSCFRKDRPRVVCAEENPSGKIVFSRRTRDAAARVNGMSLALSISKTTRYDFPRHPVLERYTLFKRKHAGIVQVRNAGTARAPFPPFFFFYSSFNTVYYIHLVVCVYGVSSRARVCVHPSRNR